MFGNHPRVNPLESRKKLLIAESELNRAQMAGDMVALIAGVRALTVRAKTFGSIASAAALLVAGLAAFRRGKPDLTGAQSPWLQLILKGAGMISTLWTGFWSGRREKENRRAGKREEREENIEK
jgi:hypothetical protein